MAKRKNKTQSPCNTVVNGVFGEFTVSNSDGDDSSSPVNFIEIVLSITSDDVKQNDFLANLEVFREVFDIEKLDFSEIMQRDIDDSRVSTELIPYLLGMPDYTHNFNSDFQGLSRFFPPIVGILIPTDGTSPKESFPEVTIRTIEDSQGDPLQQIMFGESYTKANARFDVYLDDDHTKLDKNSASLHFNNNRCKVVIVDGQHRAMALLALFRNMKKGVMSWGKRQQPYAHYYKEWGTKTLENYDLTRVELPMIICTFPNAGTGGLPSLTETSRNLFLTLNKTARKPNNTTNILLEDGEICACLLKDFLSEIKSGEFSKFSLLDTCAPIHHFQLDQHEKAGIGSTLGLTSVDYLYRLITWLLLRKAEDIDGVNRMDIGHGAGSFARRSYKETLFKERMELERHLSGDEINNFARFSFTEDIREKMYNIFRNKYAVPLEYILQQFHPYYSSIRAADELPEFIKNHSNPYQVHDALFGSKGLESTLIEYHGRISKKIATHRELFAEVSEDPYAPPGDLTEASSTINNVISSLERSKKFFRNQRTGIFLKEMIEHENKSWGLDKDGIMSLESDLTELINQLFVKFNTRFHHCGLILSFFHIIERTTANDDGTELNVMPDGCEPDEKSTFGKFESPNSHFHMKIVKEYIDALDEVFWPKSLVGVNNLLKIYLGKELTIKVSEEDNNKVFEINVNSDIGTHTIDDVYGKATPETWTRFIHMAAECWSGRSKFEFMNQYLEDLKEKTRSQLVEQIVRQKNDEWLKLYPKFKNVRKSSLENHKQQAFDIVSEFVSILFSSNQKTVRQEITDSMSEE